MTVRFVRTRRRPNWAAVVMTCDVCHCRWEEPSSTSLDAAASHERECVSVPIETPRSTAQPRPNLTTLRGKLEAAALLWSMDNGYAVTVAVAADRDVREVRVDVTVSEPESCQTSDAAQRFALLELD